MTAAAQHRPTPPPSDSQPARRLQPDDLESMLASFSTRYPGSTQEPLLLEVVRIAGAVQSTAGDLGTGTDDVLALLEMLPRHSPRTAVPSLTADQEAVLTAIGSPTPTLPPAGALAPEHAAVTARWQLVRTGRSVTQVADSLGVSTQRIRQRLKAGTLLGVHHAGSWVLPAFQFTADGHELPGWSTVCAALPHDVPAIVVEHVMTHPAVDLVRDHQSLSPAEWLLSGDNPDPVVTLAANILAVA